MKPNNEDDELTAMFRRALPLERPGLVAFCRRFTLNADDAEDLAQDTLVRAWTARSNFRGRLGVLRSWLWKIAVRNSQNNRRARDRRIQTVPMGERFDHVAVDDVASMAWARQALGAIDTVPNESYRDSLKLFVEGHGIPEIAEMLDQPMGTVKAQIHRARNQMEEWAGETCDAAL